MLNMLLSFLWSNFGSLIHLPIEKIDTLKIWDKIAQFCRFVLCFFFFIKYCSAEVHIASGNVFQIEISQILRYCKQQYSSYDLIVTWVLQRNYVLSVVFTITFLFTDIKSFILLVSPLDNFMRSLSTKIVTSVVSLIQDGIIQIYVANTYIVSRNTVSLLVLLIRELT